MESDDYWDCTAIVARVHTSPVTLIFCYRQCDSCPLSNRHGMYRLSAVEGSGVYHRGPFGAQERSMWAQFERWVRAVWDDQRQRDLDSISAKSTANLLFSLESRPHAKSGHLNIITHLAVLHLNKTKTIKCNENPGAGCYVAFLWYASRKQEESTTC